LWLPPAWIVCTAVDELHIMSIAPHANGVQGGLTMSEASQYCGALPDTSKLRLDEGRMPKGKLILCTLMQGADTARTWSLQLIGITPL